PKAQLAVAQEAGATMFGPAVNVNTTKSIAWNVARTCTIIKPCMPRTYSLAMPSSMPMPGWRSLIVSIALRVARKSPSPAAPAVSKSMPSAPASHMPSATNTMSSTAWSIAATWASRASSMRPSGRSSDQFGIGPSGIE
ncbi:MAG: hypothetical protein IH629_06845, partial [Thermoleophilia bacterium]|nr:hypothetical protein [Thermoleophilia bacterium]